MVLELISAGPVMACCRGWVGLVPPSSWAMRGSVVFHALVLVGANEQVLQCTFLRTI